MSLETFEVPGVGDSGATCVAARKKCGSEGNIAVNISECPTGALRCAKRASTVSSVWYVANSSIPSYIANSVQSCTDAKVAM